MRRVARTENGSPCGWCLSGHHLPSETSAGCSRYRDPASYSFDPACPCRHPKHALAAEGALAA